MQFKPGILILLVGLGNIVGSISARADDVQPPPWRGGPLSTKQDWEFEEEDDTSPDNSGPFAEPADQTAVTDFEGLTHRPEGDGGWQGPGFMHVDVVNFVDFLPVKRIRVQMTYSHPNPPGLIDVPPSVREIRAQDNVVGPNVIAHFIDKDVMPHPDRPGYFHTSEEWTLRPNPDFEYFKIRVPVNVVVHELLIDTISTVPEPTSLAMLWALLGAAATVRRRR